MWFVAGMMMGLCAGAVAGVMLMAMLEIGAEAERELDEIRGEDWQG